MHTMPGGGSSHATPGEPPSTMTGASPDRAAAASAAWGSPLDGARLSGAPLAALQAPASVSNSAGKTAAAGSATSPPDPHLTIRRHLSLPDRHVHLDSLNN